MITKILGGLLVFFYLGQSAQASVCETGQVRYWITEDTYSHDNCQYLNDRERSRYLSLSQIVNEWESCVRDFWVPPASSGGLLLEDQSIPASPDKFLARILIDSDSNGQPNFPDYMHFRGFCRVPLCEVYPDSPQCKDIKPEKSVGTCKDRDYVGNPCDPATGNKFQTEADFAAPGGLEFKRYYNSMPQSASPVLGGWRHSYSRSLEVFTVEYDDGESIIQTEYSVKAHRADGKIYQFYLSDLSGNEWVADADIVDRLERQLDGGGVVTGWRYITQDDSVETYDAEGRLLFITSRDGSKQTLLYDPEEKLIEVRDELGRSLQFTYNANHRVASIVDPAGQVHTYAYDPQGNLGAVTAPGSGARTYLYENSAYPHALTGVLDPGGQRYATWGYDEQGRVVSSEHAGGVGRVTLGYEGTTTTITDALGQVRQYQYQVKLGVPRIAARSLSCSGCGNGRTFAYDANGFVTSRADYNDVETQFEHSSRGLETQRIEAKDTVDQRAVQTDWHPDFRVSTERRTYDAVNTLITKSTWTYNSRGQARTSTQHDSVTGATRTTTNTYCEQANIDAGTCPLLGLLRIVDGPRTDVTDRTTYQYYSATNESGCANPPAGSCRRRGDLYRVTSALGQVTEYVRYDRAGRVTRIKDPNGIVTDLEYHPRGWLTARKVRGADDTVETDDAITRIEYAPTGLVSKLIQPDAAFTRFYYDDAHRLTDITDKLGNKIHYTLDNAGNRTQEDTRDPQGVLKRTLGRVYNQLGQLATAKDAQQHATGFTYDPNGNPDTVTDALSRVTDHDYDPLNRLSRTLQDVGGIEAETTYAYDALDNLTQVTDPNGLDTHYDYDGLGNLKTLTSPDTGATAYTFDAAGNRETQTDARGVQTGYGYDALNRLTSITYPTTALNVTFGYDTAETGCATGETFAKDRLTSFTDGTGSTKLCYDRFGNLLRKIQVTDGRTLTTRHAYDLAGRLKQTITRSNATLTYVRDTAGRITQVKYRASGQPADTVLVSAVKYYPFGPVAEITYGNGRKLLRTYDQDYAIDAVQGTGPGGLDLDFATDEVDNLTQVLSGAAGNTFEYDPLNRLEDVRALNDTLIAAYTYDATGNRQSKQTPADTEAYVYPTTSHRLQSVAGIGRGYDNAGNTTAIGNRGYVYGDHGRLTEARDGTTVLKQYAYNARGERVHKYGGSGGAILFVYDEAGRLLGEYAPSGTTGSSRIREYVWLDDLPIAALDGAAGTPIYLEPDHLGTPRVAVDPARNVAIWTWPLLGDAFGEAAPQQDPDGDGTTFVLNLRFPGQYYDSETKLHYNYYRDYEPGTGRYVESDLIGLWGGINTYAYVNSDSISHSDPLGLSGLIGGLGARGPMVTPRYLPPQYRQLEPRLGETAAQYAQRQAAHRAGESANWRAGTGQPPGKPSPIRGPDETGFGLISRLLKAAREAADDLGSYLLCPEEYKKEKEEEYWEECFASGRCA